VNECYEFIDAHIIIFIARSFFTEHLGFWNSLRIWRREKERRGALLLLMMMMMMSWVYMGENE
jgi:hypothetical protein